MKAWVTFLSTLAGLGVSAWAAAPVPAPRPVVEFAGITVTPHVRAAGLRYHLQHNPDLGARVQLFLRNPAPVEAGSNAIFNCNAVLFDEKEAQRLIQDEDWAWHDTPSAWPEAETQIPPGAMVIYQFNSRSTRWSVGKKFTLKLVDWAKIHRQELPVTMAAQGVWISAVTFLNDDAGPQPDTIMVHLDNQSATAVHFINSRLFLPTNSANSRLYYPQPVFDSVASYPNDGLVPAGDKGVLRIPAGRLPLGYAALQIIMSDVQGRQFPLWAYLRIKRDFFDISSGWGPKVPSAASPAACELYLKMLSRMHINTAHFINAAGYSDQPGPQALSSLYPLRRMGKPDPIADYDKDEWLPWIRAVECLGEPQNENGPTPRFPQAVWQALQPYKKTRLPTTVTLTEEASWRHYAGLSDLADFKAFRLVAPSTDDWQSYDRWEDGKPINWGAPLETLGDYTRCFRDLWRPMPIAGWLQGPYCDWEIRDNRKRSAPTADELRVLAYHALANRITSVYWHDVTLRGLVQYRDTIDELTRIGREIRMLEDFFLEGDAYRTLHQVVLGKPDWDLASIVSPRAALLFAMDLDYQADRNNHVFQFGKKKRDAIFTYNLPSYLRRINDVFRVDADGVYPATYTISEGTLKIADKQSKVAIYVASPFLDIRPAMEAKRKALLAVEQTINFDPVTRNKDFEMLRNTMRQYAR